MGQDEGQAGPGVGSRDPEQIKEEIAETRKDLGDTVAAVADKADVKKQSKAKVRQAKARAASKKEEVKQKAAAKREEVAGKVKEGAPASTQEGAQQASWAAQRAGQQVTQAARENPMRAVAVAAFAGLAIGWRLGRR